jgi:hypothetical protein
MATKRGTLVLGKGQARFVKRRLLWLPQNEVVLETDFCPLPNVLDGRLWIGMAVRQWNGDIQASEILEHIPSVNDLADLLAHAMQGPLSDEGRGRAEGIHLRDNPEWEELFPHLRQLKIEVVLTEALTKWDEAAAELIQYLQAQWSSRAGRQSVIKAELGYEDEMLDLKLTAIMFPCHRRARKRAGGEECMEKL